MADATIYHNPDCGTSRKALAALREAGLEPDVVEYRKTGWTKPQLGALFARMAVTPRAVLRERGTPRRSWALLDPAATDDAILTAMVAHPILVERPIVETAKGAALCRPAEKVNALI